MTALQGSKDAKSIKLTKNLSENIALFKGIFVKDSVLRTREVTSNSGIDFCLIYFDGMVSDELINESIVRPLVLSGETPFEDRAAFISSRVLFSSEVKVEDRTDEAIRSVLYGDTLLLIDGTDKLLTVNTKGWQKRGVDEPQNERVLSGPREGFNESAMTNLSLLRRRLLTPDFAVEMITVGRRTDTRVFICYLASLTEEKILTELKRRLSKIDIDGVLDGNYLTEHIRDRGGSLFRTTGQTERPDIVAANLLEGRIAIVTDGSPVAITLPYLFSENFQSDEDYYTDYKMASASRLIRIAAFVAAISAPAVYLALSVFHLSLFPPDFALAVIGARQGVPLSPVAECLVLILVFEILTEAGLRTPESVGTALSIVGGLVVGQAAVEAKIVSAPMLIAVALGGISGLMVPRLRTAVFYCRIFITVSAAALGLYGILSALVILLIYILSLKSFTVDYTESLRSISVESIKDTLIRRSWRAMIKRPKIQNRNRIRQNEKHS